MRTIPRRRPSFAALRVFLCAGATQAAHGDGQGAELAPILFPLFPHFKLHARFTNRHVFFHRCRNPFCGPALLATFHDLFGVVRRANDKQDLEYEQNVKSGGKSRTGIGGFEALRLVFPARQTLSLSVVCITMNL